MTVANAAARLLAFIHDMPRYPSGHLQHLPEPSNHANIGLASEDDFHAARDALAGAGQITVTDQGTDRESWQIHDLRPVPRASVSTNETGIMSRPDTSAADANPAGSGVTVPPVNPDAPAAAPQSNPVPAEAEAEAEAETTTVDAEAPAEAPAPRARAKSA